MSEFVLEISTSLFNTGLELRVPLSDGTINDRLVQLVPRFNIALMQLNDISNFLLYTLSCITLYQDCLSHRVSEMNSAVSSASISIVSRAHVAAASSVAGALSCWNM